MEQSGQQPQTLCIKHLAKNYSKRWVVKDVSFTMQSGQIVGLLGPNGAGKTTLLRIITGEQQPTSGHVTLNGECTIGYLPQTMRVADTTTLAEETAKAFDEVLRLEAEEAFLVASSPTRLQQLFGNLVENAIKYNKPQGRVTVTLQRQRNMVLVKVKDTGIGIPQEHLPRLFERFYRVDSSRSREIGGTGLGLSIVKHLAGLYHGDVSVESVVGEGSVFTVRLPLLEG